jgi:alpha-ribazole phosphatase
MQLIAIRHTDVALQPGICYGQLDVGIEPEALARRAPALLACIREVWPENAHFMAFSSPLLRCCSLYAAFQAMTLGNAHGKGVSGAWPAPIVDPRLMECSFGEWEGKPWNAIGRTESDAWAADFVNRAPPGGESLGALDARVQAWWRDAQAQARAQGIEHLLMVGHAATIRTLMLRAAGMPLSEFGAMPLAYGEAVLFETSGDNPVSGFTRL